ncbi:DUF4274 domain-containing protein [Zooshikella sp. RANM57]|uniref:DUF4274 domain-containing protein n=1 Tax=Zooshikella sp. RANM57 TaxID=3425863 RepID=UPI003D6E4978
MLSEAEQQKIEQIQSEDDLQKYIDIVTQASNTEFLYEYAKAYNWDDGYELPNAIADNSSCDLGTALSLFWLAEAMCYLTKEVMRDEYNGSWADFCEKLIYRLSNNQYPTGPVSFDPNIGKVEVYKLEQAGVSPVFYTKVVGST